MFSLAHYSAQIVHPPESNGSSISRLLSAKPPKPQPRPKPRVNAYAATGPQTHEKFSELNYFSIPSKPAEYKTFNSSTNPALYEPVYADTAGKETATKTHVYHSVKPHKTSRQVQYYSDPTSPSQPPDLVPPTHMYHTPYSHEDSGQVSVHYEDPTLPAYQVCAFTSHLSWTILTVCLGNCEKLLGKYMKTPSS